MAEQPHGQTRPLPAPGAAPVPPTPTPPFNEPRPGTVDHVRLLVGAGSSPAAEALRAALDVVSSRLTKVPDLQTRTYRQCVDRGVLTRDEGLWMEFFEQQYRRNWTVALVPTALSAATAYTLLRRSNLKMMGAMAGWIGGHAVFQEWIAAAYSKVRGLEQLLDTPDSELADVAYERLREVKPGHPMLQQHRRSVAEDRKSGAAAASARSHTLRQLPPSERRWSTSGAAPRGSRADTIFADDAPVAGAGNLSAFDDADDSALFENEPQPDDASDNRPKPSLLRSSEYAGPERLRTLEDAMFEERKRIIERARQQHQEQRSSRPSSYGA